MPGRSRRRRRSVPARPSSPPCASPATSTASRQKTQRKANFYEKGDKPLEIVSSRQWYIRNGGRDADLRATFVGAGDEIDFHPTFMRSRYANWVDGLNGDWLISRQRFFGVPFPVWYPSTPRARPTTTTRSSPPESAAAGRPADRRARGLRRSRSAASRGGFVADPDIMDTWATSSLTPQIAAGWQVAMAAAPFGPELFDAIFPMDLRPQAHDIIRTWLFSTVVRAHYEHGTVPWTQRRDQRLDPRPRPQEDEQVQGQRGDARGRRQGQRRRRRALLGGLGSPGHRRRATTRGR